MKTMKDDKKYCMENVFKKTTKGEPQQSLRKVKKL